MINFLKKWNQFFFYYNNLNFDQDKNFTLEFSDSDKLDGVIFQKK